MIEFYVREVHLSKAWTGRVFLHFEYFILDAWKPAKVLFMVEKPSALTPTSVASRAIVDYVKEQVKQTAWTKDELEAYTPIIAQLNLDFNQKYTRLRLQL